MLSTTEVDDIPRADSRPDTPYLASTAKLVERAVATAASIIRDKSRTSVNTNSPDELARQYAVIHGTGQEGALYDALHEYLAQIPRANATVEEFRIREVIFAERVRLVKERGTEKPDSLEFFSYPCTTYSREELAKSVDF